MALDGYTFDPNGTTGYPLAANHYREMDASGNASFSETDGEATRNLITNWNTNLDFAAALLGYATYTGVNSGVSRVLPDPHPELTWLYALAARRTAVTPSSVVDSVSNWTMAKYDTSYRPVDYFVSEDTNTPFGAPNELYRFVSRKTLPKGDYLQLSVNAFSWGFAGGNLGSVPGIIVPAKTLEYTWHMVPSKPLLAFNPLRCPVENTILRLIGTTNLGDFDTVYPQGTVLFVGAEATLIPPRFNDMYHWTIRYFFEQKDHGVNQSTGAMGKPPIEEIGVNYIFNPVTNLWDVPQIAGSTYPNGRLYSYSDLNQLFILNAGS